MKLKLDKKWARSGTTIYPKTLRIVIECTLFWDAPYKKRQFSFILSFYRLSDRCHTVINIIYLPTTMLWKFKFNYCNLNLLHSKKVTLCFTTFVNILNCYYYPKQSEAKLCLNNTKLLTLIVRSSLPPLSVFLEEAPQAVFTARTYVF